MKLHSVYHSLYTGSVMVLSILISSCSGDSPVTKTSLNVPENYDAGTYSASTQGIYTMRTDFEGLIKKLKGAREKSVTLTYEELANLYAPLQPLTMPAFDPAVETLLQSAAASSGKDFDAMTDPQNNTSGGVYGGYLFDKYGRCIDETFQKGMYAALLYYQALESISDGVSAIDIDKLVALFGASPSFPNTNMASENADVFCASYAAQRDKNDGRGLYTQMKRALITAQAAEKAGSEYLDELNAAIGEAKSVWERSMMATAISYLYSVMAKLSATDIDEASRASAMHSYGEASGILYGWRFLSASQRIAPDVQLDEVLSLIGMPRNQEPAIYVLWQQSYAELPKLETSIRKLQAIYGFTDAELEDFKTNWVSAQGRQ